MSASTKVEMMVEMGGIEPHWAIDAKSVTSNHAIPDNKSSAKCRAFFFWA